MRKVLLSVLLAVNVVAMLAIVPAVDLIGGATKGLLLSRIFDLHHQGVIASEQGREIALGLFGVAEVRLPPRAAEGPEAPGADLVAAIQAGEATFLFRQLHSMPGRMARWAAVLLCVNVLVFWGSLRRACRQGRKRMTPAKARAFWCALLVGALTMAAGIDLLAGAAYVPLSRTVAACERAAAANGFRELELAGIAIRPAFDGTTRAIFASRELLGLAGCVTALLLVDAVANVLCFRRFCGVWECEAEGK